MQVLEGNSLKMFLFLGNVFFGFAFFLAMMYLVQVQSFRSRTRKYKFVSEKEVHAWLGSAMMLSCSLGIYAFIITSISLNVSGVLNFVISGTMALVVGVGVGYTLWSYLTYYYPFILEKRLKDIRFKPMLSPITGKPMVLLNEEQEDAHLSQNMIDEEATLSVDYDVWLDEDTGDKVIERYNTRYHPLVCHSCNFRTLMERNEVILIEPGEHHKGILRKQYECIQCGHLESIDHDIPSLSEERKFDRYEKDLDEIPTHKRKISVTS